MSQNFEFVAHKNIIYGVADKESLIFCTGLRLNLEKLMVNLFEKYIRHRFSKRSSLNE